MKKFALVCAFMAATVFAIGQETLTSKKCTPIKPEAGDFALGFNALPILNYVGNTFNGSFGNTVNNSSFFVNGDNMLYGKYMTTDDMAYRVRLRIRSQSTTMRNYVAENGTIGNDTTVEDRYRSSNNYWGIGFGLERRRGKGRVVGVYGAELGYSTWATREKFTYGNQMDTVYTAPLSTVDFATGAAAATGTRTIERFTGRTHAISLAGFAGVEYFFAPKVALTGEFTWGLTFASTSDSYETLQLSGTDGPTEVKNESAGTNQFTLDTGNYGGAIGLLFYF